MRRENEGGRSRWVGSIAISAFALVLGVLIFGGYGASVANGAPGKDKGEDFTRVYRYTYDEVFAATQDAIERLGWSVTNADKDKGTITGRGIYHKNSNTFEIHVETVSPKPETRMTVVQIKTGIFFSNGKLEAGQLFSEVQKVLVTYK
jgi:hypothetical protein